MTEKRIVYRESLARGVPLYGYACYLLSQMFYMLVYSKRRVERQKTTEKV